jgi:UTP--glucose-1-phosphate uridylyltransferase
MAKVRKAVFPAAGLGTRFLPATKAQPKEMLPLVDKPIIQYVIEEAVAAGITQIIIVTGRGKNAIEDHFDVSYELEKLLEERGKTELLDEVRAISNMISVSYVRQKETLGLGHAVLVAKDLVGDEPFAVMLGDDIIDAQVPCMRQMVEVFERHGGPVVAVHQVPRDEISAYGVIAGAADPTNDRPLPRLRHGREAAEGGRPLRPRDHRALHPHPRHLRDPRADAARQGGEIQLTNGIRVLAERRPVYAYRFEGRRHDAGNKLGFLKATVEFALKRADLGGPFREYLKSLDL